MSLDATLSRVAQLEAMLTPSVAATALAPPSTAGTAATTGASTATFMSALQGAMASAPAGAATDGAANPMVAIAEREIGQSEQPPGSNDSPRIATYRSAVAGAQPGEPWCADFASWVAQQAGRPIGQAGQGIGSVGELWSWAQQTGRAVANGPGVTPSPGDLIVFGDHHVGLVEQVLPNGSIQTIEGNYSNQVSRVVRGAGEATGYVRMGQP